jgi:hypothetical protein
MRLAAISNRARGQALHVPANHALIKRRHAREQHLLARRNLALHLRNPCLKRRAIRPCLNPHCFHPVRQ